LTQLVTCCAAAHFRGLRPETGGCRTAARKCFCSAASACQCLCCYLRSQCCGRHATGWPSRAAPRTCCGCPSTQTLPSQRHAEEYRSLAQPPAATCDTLVQLCCSLAEHFVRVYVPLLPLRGASLRYTLRFHINAQTGHTADASWRYKHASRSLATTSPSPPTSLSFHLRPRLLTSAPKAGIGIGSAQIWPDASVRRQWPHLAMWTALQEAVYTPLDHAAIQQCSDTT
jgi:hypothetical protein